MNTDNLVIVVQVTLILLIGLTLVRLLQPRLPDLSAKLGILALLTANLVGLAGVFQLPRLYTFQFAGFGIPGEVSGDNHQSIHPPAENLTSVSGNAAEPTKRAPFQLGFLSSWLNIADRQDLDSSSGSSLASFFGGLVGWIMLGFSLLAIIWLLLGNVAAVMLYHRSVPVPREQWPASVLAFCTTRGIEDSLTLRVHRTLGAPCVYTFCPKTIFVPADFFDWSEHEALVSFVHEWTHLRRRDPVWRFLGELCLVSLAVHPLAYLIRRQVMLSQEIATDDQAAASLGSAKNYQTGLSQLLLRLDRPRAGLGFSIGFGAGVSGFSSSLVRRIKMLDQNRIVPTGVRRRWCCSVGVIACGLALMVGGWNVAADEPPRVAALANSSGKKVEPKLFARRKQLPSERLVNHAGAVRLNVAAAIENPLIQSTFLLLDSVLNNQEVRTDNGFRDKLPAEYGFHITGIQTLEAGVDARLFYNSPERRELAKDDKKLALGIGSNSLRVHMDKSIDWKNFVAAIDPGNITTTPEVLAEFAASLNESDTLEVGLKSDAAVESESRTPEFDAVWNLCDGGFFTAVLRSPLPEVVDRVTAQLSDELATQGEPLDSAREMSLNIVRSISHLGVGLDHSGGSNGVQGRIIVAFNPGTQIDEVSEFFRNQVGSYIKDFGKEGFVGFLPLRFPSDAQFETMTDPTLGEVLVITVPLELLNLAAMTQQE